MLRRIGRLIFKLIPLWSWRIGIYALLSALVVGGGFILTLRYAVLPNIAAYRGDLEQLLASAIGQRVSIGEIQADWHGLRPQFTLGNVVVYDAAHRPALELRRVDSTLAWSSLFFLEPRFHVFEVHEPHLDIRRSADGVISVAGIPLAKADGGAGLTDWVLRQPELAITHASVSWIDEQRGAPELRLRQVSVRLQNDFFRHRVGLRASGPEDMIGTIDLRADFAGDTVRELQPWQGQLYVALDYADLAAYKQWLDLPVDVARGRGALRVWLDIDDARVSGFTADVRLADVSARLGEGRDALELQSLDGQVGWQGWRTGFKVYARGLRAVAEGHAFRPLDFELRKNDAYGSRPANGELKANALDLGAAVHVAQHLPLDAALGEQLQRYAPRGSVTGLSARWSGEGPSAQFEVRARFEALGIAQVGAMPGLQNVSGSIDASDKRGLLTLNNRDMHLELPQVFAEPLRFDTLSGGLTWTANAGRYELRIGNLTFANADLEGSVQGSLQLSEQGPGLGDLTGTLKRAEARRIVRYVPLAIQEGTRSWLQKAVLAGTARDVKWHLKGEVARFPFADQGGGTFDLAAKLRGGVLDYAPGWPRIDDIAADLVVAGSRFELRGATGSVFGVRLARVLAVVPDLSVEREILEVAGEAQGASADFLRFVSASPVGTDVDRFLRGVDAQGRGRLTLKFTLPFAAPSEVRVAGNYQLIANRIRMDSATPVLENVDGRIDFTESSVRAQNINLQIFGGPAALTVSTEGNAVLVKASGRASMGAVHKLFEVPLLQAVQGSTDWRGSLQLRGQIGEFVLESGLQGIASSLPAPLAKTASEALPLRVERRLGKEDTDTLHVTLGPQIAAVLQRRREGGSLMAERLSVGLGVEPPAAEGPGSWMQGSLPWLDLDRWRATLAQYPSLTNAVPAVAGVDLKIGALDMFGRRFNDLNVSARRTELWRMQLSARELNGEVSWRTGSKGQIVARLQRLTLPAAMERLEELPADSGKQPSPDYPALDVIVDDFAYKDRALGRLELSAIPEGRNWRIERLHVRNPDAVFSADGLWQWQARASRTQLKLRLETTDIGKLLARMQYPQGVRGGTATLSGTLSWVGPPQDIDYPTLSGQLAVQASSGQFAKLDPGMGKLLSILSLQALPRRVTLDFKDVFSEGFAFDSIQATAKIDRGIATTDNFRILGSSARVAMSGDVDLARETQNLKVRVTPSVGDSVATVSALLGGPVVGLGVFLAQRLLNDPLGQLVAYDFSVTGTWSDPSVSKISFDRSGPG